MKRPIYGLWIFSQQTKSKPQPAYANYARGGEPDRAAYRLLQDYLFRYIAAEAGSLQMPVHIHTGAGCGGYFSLRDSEPLLLESVLNDARLRRTNFVLLHGGCSPFTRELTNLLMKPNVYTDLSEQTWMLEPRALAAVLRRLAGGVSREGAVRNGPFLPAMALTIGRKLAGRRRKPDAPR